MGNGKQYEPAPGLGNPPTSSIFEPWADIDSPQSNSEAAEWLHDPDAEFLESSGLLSDADRAVLEAAMADLGVATPVLDAVAQAGEDARASIKRADPAGLDASVSAAVRWLDAMGERVEGAYQALVDTSSAVGPGIEEEMEWSDLAAERDFVDRRIGEVTEGVLDNLALDGVADETLTGTPGERVLSAGLAISESVQLAELAKLLLEAGDIAGIADLIDASDEQADVLIRLAIAPSAPMLLGSLPAPGSPQRIEESRDLFDEVDATVDVGMKDGAAKVGYTEELDGGTASFALDGGKVKAGLDGESGRDAGLSYDIGSGEVKGTATLAKHKSEQAHDGEALEPADWAEDFATDDDRVFHEGNAAVKTENEASLGLTTDFESLGLTGEASRKTTNADGSSSAWGVSGGAKFEGLELTELSLGGSYTGQTSRGTSWGVGGDFTRTDKDSLSDIESEGQGSAERGYSASANASVGLVSVGGGYRDKSTVEARNLRGMEGSEYVEQSESGWNASAGVRSSVGGIYGTRESVEIGGRVIHFDATPAGSAARRHYNLTRTLPPGGKGYTVQSTTEGEADRSGSQFSIAGFSVGQMEEMRSTTTTNADGSEVQQDTGTDALTGGVPFLGTTVSHLNALQKTTTGGGSMFVATTQVDDRSADDAHGGLFAATGGARDLDEVTHDPDGKASGKWTVQSVISEAEIDRFIELAQDKDLGGIEIVALRGLLLAAKTRPEKQRAVITWASQWGDEALKRLRSYSKGTDFVQLEGDPYLTGLKGQLEFEDQLGDYIERASDPTTDKSTLLSDIRSMVGYQELKRTALEDRKKYPDLPGPLRRSELERVRNSLLGLEQVRATALAVMGADPDQAAGAASAGEAVADERWLRALKFDMLEARDKARHRRWVHDGGDVEMAAFREERSAYSAYGGTMSYAAMYSSALKFSIDAESRYETARDREKDYFLLSFPKDEAARKAQLGKLNAVAVHYRSAVSGFEKSTTQFDLIRDMIGAKDPLFRGYRKKMAPDTAL